MQLPYVIQGGMGAGVSDWKLARAVSIGGQLGVVAGTALDVILARRLQLGDPSGAMRRALGKLPVPGLAQRILKRYFIPGGKPEDQPFKGTPLLGSVLSRERSDLIVAANFTEVFLAKENHGGQVGINYLEKIQLPSLPSLFGAMLAGVNFVLMGAGIPRAIPGVLDELAKGQAVQVVLQVQGASGTEEHFLHFDPKDLMPEPLPELARPKFLAIVSSVTMANVMARKASGKVDGLIIEGASAGGHNAPPRGAMRLNAEGEPIFGPRDEVDLKAIGRLGLPFWLAGSWSQAGALSRARAQGAQGIQVGTAFAFCAESGIDFELKQRALERIRNGTARVVTDPLASPTGFPFKLFQLEGTHSDPNLGRERQRACDLGYLRHAYAKENGQVGWRCPAEPAKSFLKKGGAPDEALGRKCVCNGLLANVGLAQIRPDGKLEEALLTSGADLRAVTQLIERHGMQYSASDVLGYLQGCPLTKV